MGGTRTTSVPRDSRNGSCIARRRFRSRRRCGWVRYGDESTQLSQYLAAFPGAADAPEVAFNVAWVSYEQGDYKAALEGFKGFIQEYPGSKESAAAGHLVLDIHKSLDDLDGLIKDARTMLANQRITDPKFRKEVGNILAAAEHRHLEELTAITQEISEIVGGAAAVS